MPIPAVVGQVSVADAVNRAGSQYISQTAALFTYQYLPHITVTCTANITPLALAGTFNYTTVLAFVLCSLHMTNNTRQSI